MGTVEDERTKLRMFTNVTWLGILIATYDSSWGALAVPYVLRIASTSLGLTGHPDVGPTASTKQIPLNPFHQRN